MADWTDLLQRPGQSNGLAEFFLGQRQADDQHVQAQAQTQFINAQAQAKNQVAARDQQFQADWQDYIANPSPDKLLNLQGKYPEKAEAISGIWKAKDAQAKNADQGYMGSVYSALQNKRPDLAIGLMRKRRDADAAAGLDTTDDDAQIAAIEKNDPSAVNTVKGMFLAHLAAIDPDKFASTYGAVTKPEELKNVGPGSALVDPVTGKVTYQAPFAPQYRNVGQGDTLVEVGGGGQASGGAGTGQRTQFGWTPRQRNGGDNSDAAVDGKIAGMTSALGIDPDAPFAPGTSNMQIAKALTLSEGGAGSLADKNNNPANLTDPKTGKFRIFPSKEVGLAAAAAQVARNRNRGQNSIRTMVEGLPAGGSSAQQTAGAATASPGVTVLAVGQPKTGSSLLGDPSLSGDAYLQSLPANQQAAVKAIAEGRVTPPRAGTRNGEAMLDAVTRYDPTFDAANAATRVKTRVDFTSGKSATSVNAINTVMGHLNDLDHSIDDLHNYNQPFLNTITGAIAYGAGDTRYQTAVKNFNAAKNAVSRELTRAYRAASGNVSDIKDFDADLNAADSPTALHATVKKYVQLLGSKIQALGDQYNQGLGQSRDPITLLNSKAATTYARLSGEGPPETNSAGSRSRAAPTTGWGAAKVVR